MALYKFTILLATLASCTLRTYRSSGYVVLSNDKQEAKAIGAGAAAITNFYIFFLSGVVRQNVLQPQHIDHHHLGDHQMHQVAGPGMDPGVGPGAPHVPNGGGVMKVRCM